MRVVQLVLTSLACSLNTINFLCNSILLLGVAEVLELIVVVSRVRQVFPFLCEAQRASMVVEEEKRETFWPVGICGVTYVRTYVGFLGVAVRFFFFSASAGAAVYIFLGYRPPSKAVVCESNMTAL